MADSNDHDDPNSPQSDAEGVPIDQQDPKALAKKLGISYGGQSNGLECHNCNEGLMLVYVRDLDLMPAKSKSNICR